MGLVEVAGGEPVALQDRLAVERPPLPIARTLRHVGDDHVRVQVRVLRPAGAVLVRGGDEADRMFAAASLRPATDHARLVLEIGKRRLPSGQVRLIHRAPRLLVAKRVQQADALRHAEDEVEAGHRRQLLHLQLALAAIRVDPLDRDPPRLRMPAQLFLGVRVDAANQPAEFPLVHEPLQLELSGAAARPDAGRLAAARVVVVEPRRDRALVVALLPRRELRDAQHSGHYSALDPFMGRVHLCLACYRG